MFPSRVLSGAFVRRVCLSACVLLFASASCSAKNATLTAVEIFPVSGSQAYVQIDDFALNVKNEIRLCGSAATISRDSYNKLPKIVLAPGMSLERDSKGVMLLTRDSTPECAVPGNLKVDKSDSEAPSKLADESTLSGRILSKSAGAPDAVATFAPGVKIVFIRAQNNELAEFLWAQRSNSIDNWKTYLIRFPSGEHTAGARSSLAGLYVEAGHEAFGSFESSLAAGSPDASKLQQANQFLGQARATDAHFAGEDGVETSIDKQVKDLDDTAQSELTLYRAAFKGGTPGFKHLVAAESASAITLAAQPHSNEVLALNRDCKEERNLLESRLESVRLKFGGGHPDDAYQTLLPVRQFADEYPKIHDEREAIYRFYIQSGKTLSSRGDLSSALSSFQKAYEVEPTSDASALLKSTQAQQQENEDKTAINSALARSDEAESNRDYVTAFEVLDALTSSQKAAAVNARLDVLKDKFVPAALTRAKELQKAHTPINGKGDEIAIEHAYHLLQRSYQIIDDPSVQDQVSLLGESLSAYYLDRAGRYLSRPDGSGANVGWQYLQEALQYRASNIDAVRDQIERARDAHNIKSKLSIAVSFRDQTSRREAVDFANQLTDALATGLESSGSNIKVITPRDTPAVRPNFQLIGDVLQNSATTESEVVAKQSKYRSGEHEVPNEAWNAANQVYQKANFEFQTTQHEVEGAEARGKKKEIDQAKKQSHIAEQALLAAQAKLDAIPKIRYEQVEQPYTYTARVSHLKATVDLQFRVMNSVGSELIPMVQIPSTVQRDATSLEGVRPEDTTGVQASGEVLSRDLVLEYAQGEARDRLRKQAREDVESLPRLVLEHAAQKASDGDNDGAAELYILYLNSTDTGDLPDRQKAERFLSENYNFPPASSAPLHGNLVAASK